MKTTKSIFIAFILNLFFSLFEFIGGIVTNSISILSDSIHDLGDALGIGISFILEKKSKRKADLKYTYGYSRYSVLGGTITTSILMVGSLLIIYNSVVRIINPKEIKYSGMIILAIVGVVINAFAAYYTKNKDSINERSVNLHMLEDVLGWIIVLIGAIVMKFTNIYILDPILSIGVAIFILIHAIKNLRAEMDIFLEKIPKGVNIEKIKTSLLKIKGVEDVHDIHIWSMDENNNYATMHIVTHHKDQNNIKKEVRKVLLSYKISHVILELEEELCDNNHCN